MTDLIKIARSIAFAPYQVNGPKAARPAITSSGVQGSGVPPARPTPREVTCGACGGHGVIVTGWGEQEQETTCVRCAGRRVIWTDGDYD